MNKQQLFACRFAGNLTFFGRLLSVSRRKVAKFCFCFHPFFIVIDEWSALCNFKLEVKIFHNFDQTKLFSFLTECRVILWYVCVDSNVPFLGRAFKNSAYGFSANFSKIHFFSRSIYVFYQQLMYHFQNTNPDFMYT